MPGEEIGFDRMTQVYREEGRRKTLVALEPDFWDKLRAYIQRLEVDLGAETSSNPTSARGTLLRDELRKAQKTREQIYAYRERKIAALACAQASGAGGEVKGLTRLEQELFRKLVDQLRGAREEAVGLARPPPLTIPVLGPGEDAFPKGGKDSEGGTAIKDMAFVEVLEDLPPFAGPDATYRLRRGDLVTLPKGLARVLVDRGKAKEINLSA